MTIMRHRNAFEWNFISKEGSLSDMHAEEDASQIQAFARDPSWHAAKLSKTLGMASRPMKNFSLSANADTRGMTWGKYRAIMHKGSPLLADLIIEDLLLRRPSSGARPCIICKAQM